MTVKSTVIAVVAHVIAEHTNLVRKPDASDMFFRTYFGAKTEQERFAENLEVEIERFIEAGKRANLNRRFKSITKNI